MTEVHESITLYGLLKERCVLWITVSLGKAEDLPGSSRSGSKRWCWEPRWIDSEYF